MCVLFPKLNSSCLLRAAGMAVTVCQDLTVTVLEDANAAKLTERQQALRAAIQRGEPKCLGVSEHTQEALGWFT